MSGCCVPNCPNEYEDHSNTSGVSFHRFPLDAKRRTKWLVSLNLGDDLVINEHTRICSLHFDDGDFVETRTGNVIRGRRRALKLDATPRLIEDEAASSLLEEQNARQDVDAGIEAEEMEQEQMIPGDEMLAETSTDSDTKVMEEVTPEGIISTVDLEIDPPVYMERNEKIDWVEIGEILTKPEMSKIGTRPPVKPRAGTVYVLDNSQALKQREFRAMARCDTYNWKCTQAYHPPGHKTITCNRFYVRKDTASDSSVPESARTKAEDCDKRFCRLEFWLNHFPDRLVIQYLGDESVFVPIPHGNARLPTTRQRAYVRSDPRLLKAIRAEGLSATPSDLFRRNLAHKRGGGERSSTETIRDLRQVYNARRRLNASRHDRPKTNSYSTPSKKRSYVKKRSQSDQFEDDSHLDFEDNFMEDSGAHGFLVPRSSKLMSSADKLAAVEEKRNELNDQASMLDERYNEMVDREQQLELASHNLTSSSQLFEKDVQRVERAGQDLVEECFHSLGVNKPQAVQQQLLPEFMVNSAAKLAYRPVKVLMAVDPRDAYLVKAFNEQLEAQREAEDGVCEPGVPRVLYDPIHRMKELPFLCMQYPDVDRQRDVIAMHLELDKIREIGQQWRRGREAGIEEQTFGIEDEQQLE